MIYFHPIDTDKSDTNAAFGGRRKVGSPRSEVGTSHLFVFGSTWNFKTRKQEENGQNRPNWLFIITLLDENEYKYSSIVFDESQCSIY